MFLRRTFSSLLILIVNSWKEDKLHINLLLTQHVVK